MQSPFKYFPHTAADVAQMLRQCGKESLDDFYADVQQPLRFQNDYALPAPLSEIEVRRFFESMADSNKQLVCLAGAGCYNHYTPSVVNHIAQRSEFLTSYTPYQAEVSQGTLQYIFEYQSMMSQLTGMEVSNASMYDGSTATAEAMLMCVAATKKRNRVLLSETLNPAVVEVVKTYAKVHGVTIDMIAATGGVTDRDDFEQKVAQPDIAGVIVSSPNYYGIIEDYTGWADICHANKCLMVIHCVASALGVLRTPAEWGADIAVGDGQSLGLPMNFGGPHIGFLCTSKKLIRKMPGRIVGATTDADGKRAFVLTLQAREQHIRREKATSNICSNQSLMALMVTVYLSLMGPKGLYEVNRLGYHAAHYLADCLINTGHFRLAFTDKGFLNEFVVDTDLDLDSLTRRMLEQGIQFGIRLADRRLMLCVTETVSRDELATTIAVVRKFIEENTVATN